MSRVTPRLLKTQHFVVFMTWKKLFYLNSLCVKGVLTFPVQATLEKERAILAERKIALEKLQEEHTALLTESGELKSQVESLQFKLQQSNQGVPVEQTSSDTGNYLIKYLIALGIIPTFGLLLTAINHPASGWINQKRT